MHERFELDEKWLREVTDCLYWSLMYDWDIPKHIRDHYGLTEDYRLYHQLNAMKNDEYRQKRLLGEIPDVLEIDARLTHRAEELFERLCPRPPVEYLDKLNTELERLGQIAAIPESVHDILHVHPGFLAKYGIDKKVVYPHSFRHRFAKNFLSRFNDISLLADLMGHESIETTRIYLRRTSTEQQKIVNDIIDW